MMNNDKIGRKEMDEKDTFVTRKTTSGYNC
jgi:hypothetical protein